MTPEQLAEIRARAEAATPGPWEATQIVDGTSWEIWARMVLLMGYSDQPNAEFVAHSRTDIPALLDYIEALEGALKKIERALTGYTYAEDGANVALKIARAALSEPTNA